MRISGMGRIGCSLACAVLVVLAGAGDGAAQQIDAGSIADFETETGLCSQLERNALSEVEGDEFTYTLSVAPLFQTNGLSPRPTGESLPPITPLNCHFADPDTGMVLVSSDAEQYCGWISEDVTLKSTVMRSALEQVIVPQNVCGSVAPMPVRDFCVQMEALGEIFLECQDPQVAASPFQTKFIVYNSAKSGADGSVNPIEVPLFAMADSDVQIGSVKIFNVLRVYAVAQGPEVVRFLIGSNEKSMLGWVDFDDGAPWYSKLSVFFKEGSEGQVTFDEPGAPGNVALSEPPANLSQMLRQSEEFRKFPVLVDDRAPKEGDTSTKRPALQIAFIGSYCDGAAGQLCAGAPEVAAEFDISVLNQGDILFLIDGTKSMERYFGLVSSAVQQMTGEYIGNLDYQFGASMYGDYLSRPRSALGDPIQYRSLVPLGPLLLGAEFDALKDSALFIEDPMGDKPEAAHEALLEAIEQTSWRGETPRFIVHIADHGDRYAPPRAVIDALKENRIFYSAISVRGDSTIAASTDFVDHARAIFAAHKTAQGNNASTEPIVTYGPNSSENQDFEAILSALYFALKLGDEARKELIRGLYGNDTAGPETADLSRFPPGHAGLTKAALELFLDADALDAKISLEKRTLAAQGFVETAELGQDDPNWAYFAALRPGDLGRLRSSFEFLCRTVNDSDARLNFTESMQTAISVLTGDDLSDIEAFRAYFQKRESIPLASEIVLGEGLIEFARILGNPGDQDKIAPFEREICRTAKLLQLMDGRRRLEVPFDADEVEGGQLVWQSAQRSYVHNNDTYKDWVYVDDFGRATVFLPLSYLPRPAATVLGD